jgi:hypothetical protein
MEEITIKFSDVEFDAILREGSEQASPVTIAVKDKATEGGNPGAVICFETVINGHRHLVQATTTVRLLVRNLELLRARYPRL